MIQPNSVSTSNSGRSSSTSQSLTSTPVTKRSRLSKKKNISQSPGSINNDQEKSSPFHSPFHATSGTPSQQAGFARSPLSNSTIISSLNSTPNRNWLSSQDPVRDIIWDNTSPVNSRSYKGRLVGLPNINDLYKGWNSDSHEEESCPSQKYALSDKWLSAKNVSGYVLQQHIRDENGQVICNKDKQAPGQGKGGQPSKHLSSLLEIIRKPKPKLKGLLNFEESSSEEPTKEDVLVQGSDPVNKAGDNYIDELWGDDDNSFFIRASQDLDSLITSPGRKSVVTIPSTLSAENSSSTSSSSSSCSLNNKNIALEKNSFSRCKSENEKSMPVVNKLNGKCKSLHSGATNSVIDHSLTSGSISCSIFYDEATTECVKSNEYRSNLKNRSDFRIPNRNLSRKPKKGSPKNELSSGNKHAVVVTLDEEEITALPLQSQMGMPGVWMSQQSTLGSNMECANDNTAQKRLLSLKSSENNKHLPTSGSQGKSTGVGILKFQNKSVKTFEMPKCSSSIWNTQLEEDNDDMWGTIDNDIFSQENLQIFDNVIEHEERHFSQLLRKGTTQDSQLITCNSDDNSSSQITSSKNAFLIEASRLNSQSGICSSRNSNEELSKTSTQSSDSYKKQCTRMEINKKKAEALRRRKLKCDAQSKINFCGKVHPT